MSVWQTMETAPRDGTTIQARIPGHGDDNLIAWVPDTLEGELGPCGSWAFVTDQEPPDDWTDGWCWGSNEDGNPSTQPTQWKATPTPDSQKEPGE